LAHSPFLILKPPQRSAKRCWSHHLLRPLHSQEVTHSHTRVRAPCPQYHRRPPGVSNIIPLLVHKCPWALHLHESTNFIEVRRAHDRLCPKKEPGRRYRHTCSPARLKLRDMFASRQLITSPHATTPYYCGSRAPERWSPV